VQESLEDATSSFGVMFHHFYSEIHPRGQGAISAEQFELILVYLANKYEILSASKYTELAKTGALQSHQICLTFDDALLCQIDIAVPVLQKYAIEAFFFVYSSAFSGKPDPLEIYRYFRTTKFENFQEFFEDFAFVTKTRLGAAIESKLTEFDSSGYLSDFPFYSEADRKFRYLRDLVLSPEQYRIVMNQLMDNHLFDSREASSNLFMSEADLLKLRNEGHIIGLHSDSHPTTMQSLPIEAQRREYSRNREFLKKLTGEDAISMSHPCGRYSSETLEILKSLGVQVGFRSSRNPTTAKSPLEIPREDHSNILAEALR
jgi:peptidoglycan/xylan/chitin deacetylase (PgdA/CDA1 family)